MIQVNQFRLGALLIFAALFISLTVVVAPAFAQDATPEVVPTVTDTPPVLVPPASEGVNLTWTALGGLLAIVFTTGLGGGLAGAVVFIRTVRNNDVVMRAMEQLYQSASPTTQKLLASVKTGAAETAGFIEDLETPGKNDVPLILTQSTPVKISKGAYAPLTPHARPDDSTL